MKYKILELSYIYGTDGKMKVIFLELEIQGRNNIFSSMKEASDFLIKNKTDYNLKEFIISPYIKIE